MLKIKTSKKMFNRRKIWTKSVILLAYLLMPVFSQVVNSQDKLIELMAKEMERQKTILQSQETAPYYLNYRVDETIRDNINATFGNLTSSQNSKKRILTVNLRVGDYQLDNFREIRGGGGFGFLSDYGTKLPLDNQPEAICQILWKETDKSYRQAVEKYAKVKANIRVKVESEDKSDDFSKEQANTYFEKPFTEKQIKIDKKKWEEKVKKYSKVFLDDPDINSGTSNLRTECLRHYFVSSDGSRIVYNLKYSYLNISGSIKAEDGMVLSLNKSYFAFDPDDLPDDKEIIKDAKELVIKLKDLSIAPIVEPYSGPALLSGKASGVFFHEIFGHRIEGERQKSVNDAQTFTKKVGEIILPEHMSVIMDPTIKSFENHDLNGYYLFDDQGVKGEKVNVIENGILKDFLMSRTPIENFSSSNGHGRGAAGYQPEARQSNMIINTEKPYSMKELRLLLIEEAKTQGKEYAYLFESVTGGFTNTGRFMPNAFNVTPTEVYRIYVDGRPDELVRGVDLVGTPLAMFSQIEAAGDLHDIFTGFCGAKSGRVPVTAISPAMFVKRIEMQKKSKSQERLPILGRPDVNKSKK